MKFYVGLHQPGNARNFDRAFISINRVRRRKKIIQCGDWILDSGAFTEIMQYGGYRYGPERYAIEINDLALANPGLTAAVAQDYMCEDVALSKTGLDIAAHQRMTIERYDSLHQLVTSTYVMPVLQGYDPQDYVRHIWTYGRRLPAGAYVGVGSVCKRNVDIGQVAAVLKAIKNERSDLRLHGFGLKTTCLADSSVRDKLYSADSMAWSWAARKEGRDANDWKEARDFALKIERMPVQIGMEI